MSKHLKTRVISQLAANAANFCPLPPNSTPQTKSVRYFRPKTGIVSIRGAMDTIKAGRKAKKRIIVRPSRHRLGFHELYTYHFPKHWSAACVANRELMHIARLQAHAIEHEHSYAALEWRVRQIANYYNPEPGMKRYSRLFHYVYAAILRDLRSAQAQASVALTFEPIEPTTSSLHCPKISNNTSIFEYFSPNSCTCQKKIVPLQPLWLDSNPIWTRGVGRCLIHG